MKPTNTDNISCIIFGHNFYKPQEGESDTDHLKCKNCNSSTIIDKHGNFNTSGADKTFESTLRALFLLKRKIA
ncbi:hypothetical protein BTO05_09320 [Winogradskyella sp. PC-19]|uniref:hypothetical protein n=1 Tax=unclassified Winogradskyella TaxID=2615021 RepID=UPI000B3CE4A5|nr:MULTISPECIES: hypothetical protein [unclassified Winogradskyella]ARV09831.1 hypothetical protein BTO05_09320 [Winogradskyella sp. PC-19]